LNELLAFDSRSPRTKAEIVATTAIDTETTLFVSSERWCCGTRRLISAPANAPANVNANTIMPMTIGLNVVALPEIMRTIPVVIIAAVYNEGFEGVVPEQKASLAVRQQNEHK
jgi:hypothetical protein